MTIEATLQSIDNTLKLLLAAVTSGVTMADALAAGDGVAEADGQEGSQSPESETKRGRGRPRKNAEAPAQAPAPTAPTTPTAPVEVAAAPATTASASTPSAAPVAPAPQASTAATDGPTWDEAVAALKSLSVHAQHGSAAVVALIKKIDPSAANVPALKDKGKNAEIVAAVNALLNPTVSDDALFG